MCFLLVEHGNISEGCSWMDGWMNGWMDGWVDGWMGGWMDGWMDGWCYSKANLRAMCLPRSVDLDYDATGGKPSTAANLESLSLLYSIFESAKFKSLASTSPMPRILIWAASREGPAFICLCFASP